ncbi:MAG TPA: hypothetical protein VMM15_15730 [Bradyrhizobium sp.]|nr:hypothetical protein [Bradyrhizobium sp.]
MVPLACRRTLQKPMCRQCLRDNKPVAKVANASSLYLAIQGRLVTIRILHDSLLVCSRFISSSLLLSRFSGATETLPEQWRREWWSLHIEAWRRSDLGISKYCRQRCPTDSTSGRLLKQPTGDDTARKLEKYHTNCAALSARKSRKGRKLRRFIVSPNIRNRHAGVLGGAAEAMNWSGMAVRAQATVMQLSFYSLRRQRNRLDSGETDRLPRAYSSLCPAGR